MDFAENSWPSVITESGTVILVGQIRRVEGPQPVGVNQQTGTATVRVVQELTPRRWQGPPEIAVGFTQLTSWQSRLREGNGGWNGVDVQPGVMLVMALASGHDDGKTAPVSLQAVSQVSSVEDPQVAAVVQALRIEATPAPQERLSLLREALNSDLPVLESYAHFALGRKQRVPRNDATALEIALLLDPTKPDTKRLAAESTLDLELWANADPNDPANRSIVAALLQVLARQESGLQRSTTVDLHRLLFSVAPPDPAAARMYRSNLLKNNQIPDVKALTMALNNEQKDPSVGTQAEQLIHLFSEERF